LKEIHLRLRPSFGKIERTGFHGIFGAFDSVFRPRLEHRLHRVLREHQIQVICAIPHQYGILPVVRVATRLDIPNFLSVHDDLEYTASGHQLLDSMLTAMGNAWPGAKDVFVISEEIGQEYSRRYGARDYQTVTDGLISAADAPQSRPAGSLRVSFMEGFHLYYGSHLCAILDAPKIVRSQHTGWDISVTSGPIGNLAC
jgi:hypothetical protein